MAAVSTRKDATMRGAPQRFGSGGVQVLGGGGGGSGAVSVMLVSYDRMSDAQALVTGPSGPTAERLLVATRACIAEQGVAGATSREIAAAAGTNLQAITYHYGSKDRLVARALVETVHEWVEPALAVMAAPGDPATQMLSAVQALTERFERRRSDAPALLEALALAPRRPELRTAIVDLWTELRRRLAAHLTALQADVAAGRVAASTAARNLLLAQSGQAPAIK